LEVFTAFIFLCVFNSRKMASQ